MSVIKGLYDFDKAGSDVRVRNLDIVCTEHKQILVP
jgi:hypothetical protein